MSWQGNECFVAHIEYSDERFNGRMLEAMEELLWMYGDKGNGWYLLGNFETDDDEEDYDPFNPTSWKGSAPSCFCWMPNPYMAPAVEVIQIRNAHDLLCAAFECVDTHYDVIGYAGDGNEPFEHMVIYGEECDLRIAWKGGRSGI